MTDWLETFSGALPLTYAIEALNEVKETSLVTDELLGNLGVILSAVLIALTLAGSTPRRRAGPLQRSTRHALRAIPAMALVIGGVVATSYVLQNAHVSTDNAQIDGDKISVTAPADGTLVAWDATQGSTVRKNQVIGRIEMGGGFGQAQRLIRAPSDGTVARDNVVEGAVVLAGTELAVAYDLTDIVVTARVDETDIDSVRLGRQVDISVDAYPDLTFTGYVREIQYGTEGVFTAQANTTANFQRLTQVIPVKITITDRKDLTLVPGMNVIVKIHKD
jgi:multidrug resistance efflux pump